MKRAAIIVKPKQPYLDWAKSLDEAGVPIGDDFMPEPTVYLLEEVTDVQLDVGAIIAPYVAAIFEEELGDWHSGERD